MKGLRDRRYEYCFGWGSGGIKQSLGINIGGTG